MEVSLLTARPSVLIVDELEETHEVLRTVLEQRGVQILDASRTEDGLQLARLHHPDLIVLDVDREVDGEKTAQQFEAESTDQATPIVVLGTIRRRYSTGRPVMAKPFHYGTLIRRIEDLLDQSPGSDAA